MKQNVCGTLDFPVKTHSLEDFRLEIHISSNRKHPAEARLKTSRGVMCAG